MSINNLSSFKKLFQKSNVSGNYIGEDVHFFGMHFDSRLIKKNQIFVAIDSQRDGHEYIDKAIENGAVAVIVTEYQTSCKVPQLVVKDTIICLGDLAKTYRLYYLKAMIIAITGTCGKTTTKDILYSILSQTANTISTLGNFNNHLGAPLTIFRADIDTKYLILEAGTSGKGEIKYLAEIIQPNISYITNIGASHLENLIDYQGVINEKGELFKHTSDCIFINTSDKYINKYIENFSLPISTVNIDFNSINIFKYEHHIQKFNYKNNKILYTTSIKGKHNLENIVAAIDISHYLNISEKNIIDSLNSIEITPGRFEFNYLRNNLLVIDDSYNASFSSVKNAINYSSNYENSINFLVLGNMAELGDKSKYFHKEIADYLLKNRLHYLYLFGNKYELKPIIETIPYAKYFKTHDDLFKSLIKDLNNITSKKLVMVKGSRSCQLNKIVELLKDNY